VNSQTKEAVTSGHIDELFTSCAAIITLYAVSLHTTVCDQMLCNKRNLALQITSARIQSCVMAARTLSTTHSYQMEY